MEDGNGEKPSGFKKILDFVKKNPAMSGTLATVSLYTILILAGVIIIVVIMQSVISAFSTFFGVVEDWFTGGKYKDMTLEELQNPDFDFGSCYMNTSDNWFDGSWKSIYSALDPGIQNECELIEVVKHTVKRYEKKFSSFDLKISPGLVVSTIIYSYSSQPRIDGEKVVDPGQPMQILADIAKDGIFTEDDIDKMVRNMILVEGFWYYNCETIYCNQNGTPTTNENNTSSSSLESGSDELGTGKECVRKYYYNVKYSREKYEVFLKYGELAASLYQVAQNHNKSTLYICDSCYKEWNSDEYYKVTLDVTKYINKDGLDQSKESLTLDQDEINVYNKEYDEFESSLSGKLNSSFFEIPEIQNNNITYKDGFIYNKFPNYKTAFEDGTKNEEDFKVFETIQKSIISMQTYEEALNKIFGVSEEVNNSFGNPILSLRKETKNTTCPSEESCNCSNGNLSPSSGVGGPTTTADSSACSYLPINTTSETMIRLRTCVGVEADISRIMPGGTATIDPETGYYVADVPITLKRYIIGVAFAETGANEPVEGLKMQMLAAQTYLFNSLERGGIRKNSNGELLVKTCSTQFQAYYDEKVVKSYDKADSTKKKYFDDAYDAIKNQLVFDSRTNLTIFAEFGKDWTNARTAQANAGMLYTEMLTSSEVLNYSKKGGKKNWLYGVLHTCTAEESTTGAGTFVPDAGITSNYKTNSTYTQQSQTLGIFGYLTYYQPDPNNRAIRYDGRWESSNIVSVKKDCGNGLVVSWRVHKLAKTTFEKAAEGICQLTTTGIDGIIVDPSNITFNGSFYPRKVSSALSSPNLSLHSFGVAMDINSNYNVTINGKTYKDVYDRNLNTYESLVSALGSELDPRNVNYVLWKKVFQKLGFKWGGNWGRYGDDNEYDGMHFEIDWRQTK